MKIGYSVSNSITTKVNNGFYVGIARYEISGYKTTKVYNYALDILLIKPNYRQYGFR